MTWESDDKEYECQYCDKDDFRSKHERDRHVAYNHVDEDEKIPKPKKRRKKKHSIIDDFKKENEKYEDDD